MAATPLAVASGCRQQPTDWIVRLGSFSDLGARSCEVRFTLKTRHRQPSLSGPKSSINRHGGPVTKQITS